MNFGPMEMGLIFLAILLLFGYKRLPDASRSLGRSMRIFKGEMKGMKDDDARGAQVDRAPSLAAELPPANATGVGDGGALRSPESGARSTDVGH